MQVMAVFLGGMLGAICRYILSNPIHISSAFPFATFLINSSGCFFLAWFLTYASKWRSEVILFVGTGFTGAFTTFSTFTLDNVKLISSGQYIMSMVYIIGSIGIGLTMSGLGSTLAMWQKRRRETC